MNYRFCFACAFLLSLVPSLSGSGLEDMRGFTMEHVKIPIYSRGDLQLVAFSDTGKREERLLIGNNTLLDMLKANANVDMIADGWGEKLYTLEAALPEVLKFWSKRYLTSDAVLFTPRSVLDQESHTASGEDPVFLRSPMLDVNGIGFRVDFDARTGEVDSDVHIVARTAGCDPRKLLTGTPGPAQYKPVKATSDTMRIDMKNNEIMLIGSVKVIDGDNCLECDRMTIFLKSDDESAGENTAADADNSPDSARLLKGVSRILADGDVIFTRRGENEQGDDAPVQQAVCDHLEYETASGKIIMTGEERRPAITQGSSRISGERIELLRLSNKAFVLGDCRVNTISSGVDGGKSAQRTITSDRADFDGDRDLSTFTGNVQVTDDKMTMTCRKMRVFLKPPLPAADTATAADAGQSGKAVTGFSPVSGHRKLDRILCEGSLRVIGKAAGQEEQNELSPSTGSVITSDRGEFDYSGNKIIFYDNVKARDDESALDCDRLDLFLVDKPEQATAPDPSPTAGGMPAEDKSLQRIIAAGNVKMIDKESTVTTDLMIMDFQDLPLGAKPAPGMFQSGGVQLTKISCDGKVIATNSPARKPQSEKSQSGSSLFAVGSTVSRTLKADHAFIDLLADRSEFHENVSVRDANNELRCRNMFVYTGKKAQEPSAAVADDPDADPFALDMGEDSAPSRIALSDGVDLKRIICRNSVVLTQFDDSGEALQAGGDTAVYDVASRDITITSTPPDRPYLRSSGRKQFSDKITGNLATEEMHSIGNVEVMPDR